MVNKVKKVGKRDYQRDNLNEVLYRLDKIKVIINKSYGDLESDDINLIFEHIDNIGIAIEEVLGDYEYNK